MLLEYWCLKNDVKITRISNQNNFRKMKVTTNFLST